MFIGLRGTFAVTSKEDLAKVLGPTLETLKTKDYQRSEFIETHLRPLLTTWPWRVESQYGIEHPGLSLSEYPSATWYISLAARGSSL
jgi:hypothetical protein